MKFEWNGAAFVPEGGDPMGVTVTATAFKENDPSEPVEATWTSAQTISTVVVKSGSEECTYPGGIAGTVESCPASGGSPDLATSGLVLTTVAVPLGVLGAIRRRRR